MHAQLNSLLLAIDLLGIAIPVGCALGGVVLGFFVGKIFLDKIRSAKIGSAESVIARMKEDAEAECKAMKKEAALEAKEQ